MFEYGVVLTVYTRANTIPYICTIFDGHRHDSTTILQVIIITMPTPDHIHASVTCSMRINVVSPYD